MGVAITLSREMGSGGEIIAGEVAAALHLRVVGSEIIHQALEAGIPASFAVESDEGRLGFVQRALDFLRVQPTPPPAVPGIESGGAYISDDIMGMGDDYYLSILESIIFDLAQTEDVLLIGRAGQMILRGKADTLHVRIHAPLGDRVKVVAERFHMPDDEAQRKVTANDEARAAYLRRHYKADNNDVRLYDLAINTGTLPSDEAVKLIVAAAKVKFGRE
jgi:CMP/dCMP kinase